MSDETTSIPAEHAAPEVPTPDAASPDAASPDVTTLCPQCAEEILAVARRCRHCGTYVDPADPEREKVQLGPGLAISLGVGFALLSLIVVLTMVVGAISYPALIEADAQAQVEGVLESLESLGAAQERYRQGPGAGRYGELPALGRAGLLDPALASGLRAGYAFEVAVSDLEPQSWWMAIATPMDPDSRASRYFAINHTGQVYARQGRAIPLDRQSCEVPPDAFPAQEQPRDPR